MDEESGESTAEEVTGAGKGESETEKPVTYSVLCRDRIRCILPCTH